MTGNIYTLTLQDVATWPVPNYTNPVERTWLPIFAIVWTVLTTILVGGRLYLRFRTRWGLDDVFLFAAWVFAVAFTAVACVAVWSYDVSRHIWDVRPDHYDGGVYMGWVAQIMFIHSTGAIKTSVLLFYARMAKDYGRGWLYTVWVLLVITVGSWIGIFVAYCFMCQPLHAYWTVHVAAMATESYTCLDGDAMTISTSVITIASDVWTAALPCIMFQFHDLGVSKRQKVALNVIFCLGFLVTGPAIARTYYLWKIGHEMDISWIGYNLFVASTAECQLAIMCTCAPFLRAFFRKYFPNMTHKTRSTKSDTATNTTMDERPGHVNFSRPRTLLKPLWGREDVIEMDFEANHEKKGLLVLDEHTGRLVWSPGPSNQPVSKF